ncbi:hypothetical protein CPC08DRAFT_645561, partial [Agrocybe pediades]
WTSAHSNVTRNERVNKEGKKAAQGNSTPCPFLPQILQYPRPIGTSPILQAQLAKEQRQSDGRQRGQHSPGRSARR